MSDLIKATNVGDSWNDVTGGVSTIVHVSPIGYVVRRGGNKRFPTFTVYSKDGTVVASGVKTLTRALSC